MSNHYAARDALLKSKGFANYAAYLESQTWADIRIKVLNAANRRCCACKKWATQVHHEQYTEGNLFGADSMHLFAICAKHHEKIEFTEAGEKIFDQRLVASRLRALIDGKIIPASKPSSPRPPRQKTHKELRAERRKAAKAARLAKKQAPPKPPKCPKLPGESKKAYKKRRFAELCARRQAHKPTKAKPNLCPSGADFSPMKRIYREPPTVAARKIHKALNSEFDAMFR